MLSFLSLLRQASKPAPSSSETREHFSQFAHSWWDEDGPFSILHMLNPVRLAWLKEMICQHFGKDIEDSQALKGLQLIDIGCGGGLITEPLCRMGGDVTGLDLVLENIACAQEHAQRQDLDITYLSQPLHTFGANPENQERFDVVIAFEVIEHVDNPENFIKSASQLLRPGGLFLLSTLNRTFWSYALGIIAAEYILRWVPPGTHTWQAFLTPSDLRWHFTRAGLTPGEFQGLSFSLLQQKWTQGTDLSVNYFASALKPSRDHLKSETSSP